MSEITEVTSKGYRPSRYDPDLVRDMSVQVLIGFYNHNQDALRDRIRKDPDFISKLRQKAQFMDAITRSWLDVIEHVPREHPNYRRELMFYQWCLRLEPSQPFGEVLKKLPMREQELRAVIEPHLTAEYWNVNCKRWVDGIRRVREDKSLVLKVPPTLDPTQEDDDDDHL